MPRATERRVLIFDGAADLLSEPEIDRIRQCEACVVHFLTRARKGLVAGTVWTNAYDEKKGLKAYVMAMSWPQLLL
jgi:hypothetical protein